MIHHPEKTEANLRARYDALVDYKSFDDAAYQWCFDQLGISMEPTDRVLDLGCGRGTFCDFVSRRYGVSPVGVDYSLPRIEAARETGGGTFIHSTIQEYWRKRPRKRFHHIALFEVLEHLEAPHGILDVARDRAGTVIGSLPLNHPNKSHIWDFPTMRSIREFLGKNAQLIQKPDSYRVFFVIHRRR